jgi:benzoylformate decarboxylase
MTTVFVLQTLAELRPADSIVVEEAPSARPVMQAHLPITRSEGFFTMDSGGLGWGLPAAVGVALGKPGRRIVAVIGDCSSLYSIQAIWSAVQWRLPIAILILNNRRYAALQDFAPALGFSSQGLPSTDQVPLRAGHADRNLRRDYFTMVSPFRGPVADLSAGAFASIVCARSPSTAFGAPALASPAASKNATRRAASSALICPMFT